MAAFRAAVTAGADGIEVDVRRTADGIMVIHHNRSLTGLRTPIAAMSFSQMRKAAKVAGYRIPTLEETVRYCSNRLFLDVELKEAGYEAEVIAACRKLMRSKRVIFTSFYPDVVKALKAISPESNVGLLVGLRLANKVVGRWRMRSPLGTALDCGADFIAPHWRLATAAFCRRAHEADLPVVVWTVNRASVAQQLMKQQVAAIITNYVDRLRAVSVG